MDVHKTLFQCSDCDFISPDQTIVVSHLETHQTHNERQMASFYDDAYAVTTCDLNKEPSSNMQGESSCAIWSEEQTKLLIDCYREKKPLVEEGKLKTMKRMWEKIREVMLKYNYDYSIQQLENKWKSLERSYKTVVENKNKTGRGRRSCPYERELGEILEKRHSINPVCVIDSTAGNSESNDSCNSNTPRSTTPESTIRTPKRNVQNNTLQELQKLRLLYAQTSKHKEEMEQKKFQQKQEILEELRIKNKLLEKLLEKNN